MLVYQNTKKKNQTKQNQTDNDLVISYFMSPSQEMDWVYSNIKPQLLLPAQGSKPTNLKSPGVGKLCPQAFWNKDNLLMNIDIITGLQRLCIHFVTFFVYQIIWICEYILSFCLNNFYYLINSAFVESAPLETVKMFHMALGW